MKDRRAGHILLSWPLLLVPVVTGSALACLKHAPKEVQPDQMNCAGVEISTTRPVFAAGLDIEYQVSVTDGDLCVPNLSYGAEFREARATYIAPAAQHIGKATSFNEPVLFESAMKWIDDPNPLGEPDFLQAAVGGPVVFTFPSGEYRLVLRYRRGNCAGRKFASVCLVSSPPFTVGNDQDFVVER